MAKAQFPCKYHPKEKTTRRCFHCKEYICKLCQKRFAHHLFCGFRCVAAFLLSMYGKKLKLTYRDGALIAFLLILQVMFYLLLRGELVSHFNQQKDSEAETLPLTSENLKFSLDSTIKMIDYRVEISGDAPENSMIIVQHNGEFRSPGAITRNGRFKFKSPPLFMGENRLMLWALLTPQKEIFIDSLSVHYYSKKLEMNSRSISRLNSPENLLALTFDAGSAAFGADSIIQILTEHDLAATFFITGSFIKKYPAVVQSLIDHDFELGNHTYSHPHLTQVEINGTQKTLEHVDRSFVYRQLNRADSILYLSFNRHFMPIWRAPYGEYNEDILLWAAEQGYRHIHWSDHCDTWDYVSDKDSPLYRTHKEIYHHLISLEQKGKLTGSIILMHLGSDRQSDYPYLMLSEFIKYMKERGYKFVTISQLLHSV